MQILVFFFSFFFFTNVYADNSETSISREIDLNSENIEDSVKLEGKWGFYPKQFLNFQYFKVCITSKSGTCKQFLNFQDFKEKSNKIEKSKQVIQVPETNWHRTANPINKLYYGTYHLRIVLKNFSKIHRYKYINFYIPPINSSYKLFINNKLYVENGKISKEFSTYKPSNLDRLLIISREEFVSQIGPSLDLILQVSSFNDFYFGIDQPIDFFLSKVSPVLYGEDDLLKRIGIVPIVGIIMALIFSYFINMFYLQYRQNMKNLLYILYITLSTFLFGLFSLSVQNYFFPFLEQVDVLFLKELKLSSLTFLLLFYICSFNNFFEKPLSKRKLLLIIISSIVALVTLIFLFKFFSFIPIILFFSFWFLILFILSSFLIRLSYNFAFKVKSSNAIWIFLVSLFVVFAISMDFITTLHIPFFHIQPIIFLVLSCYFLTFLFVRKMFLNMKLENIKKLKKAVNYNLNFLPNSLLAEDKEDFPNIKYSRDLSGVLCFISLNKIESNLELENDDSLFSASSLIFDIIKQEKGHIVKFSSNFLLLALFESWENAINSSIFIQRELSRKKSVYAKKIKVFIGMEYFESGLVLNYVGSRENLYPNIFSLSILKYVKKIHQKAKDFNLKVLMGPNLVKITNLEIKGIKANFYREIGTFFSYTPFTKTTLPVSGERIDLYQLLFAIQGDVVLRNKAIASFYYNTAYKFMMSGNLTQAASIYKSLKTFNPTDKTIDTYLKFSLDCLKNPAKFYEWK